MTRRRATIALHWLTFLLLIFVIAGGGPVFAWAFGLVGLAFAALSLSGVMNGPGPKLGGALRRAHPWMTRGMYAIAGGVAAATIYALLSGAADLSLWHMVLLSAASLHGIFNLWRHTAMGDGALRRILPRALHDML